MSPEGNLIVYAHTCNHPACSMLKEGMDSAIATISDSAAMEARPQHEVDNLCNAACSALNLYVQCSCASCPNCHDDCGLSNEETCKKYLRCGPNFSY